MAADLRVARRDGRRVGAVRSVGAAAARRHRHRARVRFGEVVAVESRRDVGPAARPVLPRALWASIPRRSPASRRGRCSTRARRPSATSPKSSPATGANAKDNPNAQVAGDFSVDELLQAPYVRAPLRGARLPAHLRRRGRGRAGARRPGAGVVRAARVDPGSRPSHRGAPTGDARPHLVAVDHDRGAQGRLRRRSARRGRAVVDVQPAGAHPAGGARPRRRRQRQPVRRCRWPPTR